MLGRISTDCTRPIVIYEVETKEKITELVGLSKSTVQDIKIKIDNYTGPLPHKAVHKPRLTARHCKSRLRWAKDHLNWTEDHWRNVVWSDESSFCVEGSKRVMWGSGDAMVWGCFWGGGFGPLEIIDTSSVDQEIYQCFDQ
ncbi:hypothetical protein G6F57_009803 [Rhizopus arrhizus]|uniref:Transposase Tc1-like domain-containing protein n=1 Tax=Rhizopus oryzae TaxID=64495 RepID=A0A9P6X347_RHIOR|nr:hypothetical protein G6F23_006331 [Rhizopus arrhizus]KAG1402784.1 hypothetical protein G6F58_010499 [Rhizopus delemar]KAG0763419.1 hypothetical protein G6F24_006037 [Rhizopus arrhizus]KAG0787311.1 hypothetical protein G6F21_007987 [Rhizopus arrhizus]KAG0795431.1 hypothetical protein G6F22_005120 [Rhizopus arrhizus]